MKNLFSSTIRKNIDMGQRGPSGCKGSGGGCRICDMSCYNSCAGCTGKCSGFCTRFVF